MFGKKSPPITEAWRGITFTRRAIVVGGAQTALFGALAARMAYISVVDNERYVLQSESNRVNLTLVPPRRGWIVDRHGKALANNEFIRSLDDDSLLAFIKQGRSPSDPKNTTGIQMPPKGGNPAMSDDDILDVIAYLRTLQGTKPGTPGGK